MHPVPPDSFDGDPSPYVEYLRSPLGRLRTELAWAHLGPFLRPRPGATGRALDLGAGTGEMALRLAGIGWQVTAVDRAPRMLERAAQAAEEQGLRERIDCRTIDLNGGGVSSALGGPAFDLVLCHNVLEYVDSPEALLREALESLGGQGTISVVVRARAGEVLKHAIREGDLALSTRLLSSSHVCDGRYGLLRLFDQDEIERILGRAGFEVQARRGIRVVADYLTGWTQAGEEGFARVLAFERRLAEIPELGAVARYLQLIAAPRGAPSARGWAGR
jgi:S-adenosylmethionine-dependent methyltransferase